MHAFVVLGLVFP